MAQLIADRRDVDFVLFEQLDTENLLALKKFKGQNRKMYDMIINEARKFAIKEILPMHELGDKEGLRFENNQVFVPEAFHRAFDLFRQGEWIAMTEDPEIGGQGLPFVIAQAATEYILGADFSFSGYGMVCHGSGKMIELFGTEKQKELFLRKMYAGEWGGTMVLTEPNAGSDVGSITTTAEKNSDGTYTIKGNKIFISCGEHDLTENIIHPVLARIKGAPSGTKGISLFIVPKIWVNDDGSLGEANDVVCTGIEKKMGIHASPTCSLTFGDKGKCRGLLLGEENKGMRVMFHMMNEARLGVGGFGLFNASNCYLYAINYARERIQGRDIGDMFNKDAPSIPIIRHPDVRRMLIWMKSHVEGMRSFIYYVASLFDKAEFADGEEKERYNDLIALLTPIVKSYCTDRGFEVCVQAMQVYGGYGYTKDYPIESILRDSKINSIYEGTNGIQAMDLLGRKIGMKKGMVFMALMAEIQKVTTMAQTMDPLAGLANDLTQSVNHMGEIAMRLGESAMSPNFKTAFAFATPFLEVMGDVIMGWMLLWRATVAQPKLDEILGDTSLDQQDEILLKNKNAAFYAGQVKSAEYFIRAILPITKGRMDAIAGSCQAIVEIPEIAFGG